MKRRNLVFVLFLIFLSIDLAAQKSAQEFLKEADKYVEAKDFKNALTQYFQALRFSKDDPNIMYKIGMAFLQTEDKAMAASYLEKAYKANPEIHPDILFDLGIAYQSSFQFVKAKYVYEQYKKRVVKKKWPEIDMRIQQVIFSNAMLSNPHDVLIENVGSNINSEYNDYAPIVSPDEQMMIFTSNRLTEEEKAKNRTPDEDIYMVKKDNDNIWGIPAKIGNKVNSLKHDACASLSPDGKTLFLYYSANNGDLYTSKLSPTHEWEDPIPLNKNINTPMFKETSASITADGKKLFFSSTRPDGSQGGLDIYMSELDATGQWGKAVNLGPIVNTNGNEDSPFIHPDGNVLYFSSDGHQGMGSADIFKTEFKDGAWQKPQNLGYPVNSIEYDGFFTITPDHSTGYYATRRKHGVGGYDILKVTYRAVKKQLIQQQPQQAPVEPATPAVVVKNNTATTPAAKEQPKATTTPAAPVVNGYFLDGFVTDKDSNLPLGVSVTILSKKTNSEVASVFTDDKTGKYTVKIYQPGDYVLTAEKQGYLYNSVNIKVTEASKGKTITNNFLLQKPNVGSMMVLHNVFFDTGKSDLKPTSIDELEKIRKMLLENPNLKVRINGHTDNVGDPDANKLLSLKRALAVVNHLALNGIEFDRLSAKGYGSEKPRATNDDEKDGRELNRRTEIEILDVAFASNQ